MRVLGGRLDECRAQLRGAVGRGDDFAHQLEVTKEHLALEIQRGQNDRQAAAHHLQVWEDAAAVAIAAVVAVAVVVPLLLLPLLLPLPLPLLRRCCCRCSK